MRKTMTVFGVAGVDFPFVSLTGSLGLSSVKLACLRFAGGGGSEGSEEEHSEEEENTEEEEEEEEDPDDKGKKGKGGKTGKSGKPGKTDDDEKQEFTTEELVRKLTKEKNEGRRSILREMGLSEDDIKNPKKAAAAVKKLLDSQKSETQLAAEAKKAAEGALSAALSRAEKAEQTLALTKANINTDIISAEDVQVIVSAKVDDDTTFEEALAAVKKAHPSWFGTSENGGTGHTVRNGKHSTTKPGAGYGAALAQRMYGKTKTKKEE